MGYLKDKFVTEFLPHFETHHGALSETEKKKIEAGFMAGALELVYKNDKTPAGIDLHDEIEEFFSDLVKKKPFL